MNKEKYVLIAERSRVDVALRLSYASKKIYEKKGYKPFVIYDYEPSPECYKIYDIFKIEKILRYNEILNFFTNLRIFISTIFITIFSLFKIYFKGLDWFVDNFKIKEIFIGDLIYDRYIRTENKYLYPKLRDKKFLKLLFFGILKVITLKKIFDLYDIKISLVGSKSYISMSSLILRISQQRKIKSLFLAGFGYKIFDSKNKYDYDDPLKNSIISTRKKVNKTFLKNESNKYFNKKLKGKLNYNKKKGIILYDEKYWKDFKEYPKFTKELIEKKKKYSKLIIFASHSFSENNHYTGNIVFRDYFQHFLETLRFAKNDKKNLWLFKLHPASNEKYTELKSSREVLKKKLKENILMVPLKYNNELLFKQADLVISTRGTICLEAATFGINNIITTKSFFSGFGFTDIKNNKKEYFRSFKKKQTFKKLSNNSINCAKEILYLSKKIYRDNLFNILPVRRLLNKKQFNNELKRISTKKDLDQRYDNMINKIL